MAETATIPGTDLELRPLGAGLPTWHATVATAQWQSSAHAIAYAGGRLVALWGSDRGVGDDAAVVMCAAYAIAEGLAWLELELPGASARCPDLGGIFPAAARMQRATTDLLGIEFEGAADSRPWIDHGLWPRRHPLRHDAHATQTGPQPQPQPQPTEHETGAPASGDAMPEAYPFVRVEGDGVHEIAVGPVHAGTIEPGHFRFSVVGEKVLRLEQRLGYTHKGIERRFTEFDPRDAHRLAGRVSGDSTVAYAWAYCMALESAAGCTLTERALRLRALLLERERVANHLGDLGALGNDAGFAFGLAQFSRLREDWQRLSMEVFGHRLLMDCVSPGGVQRDPEPPRLDAIRAQCDAIEREVHELRSIYDEHAGLQDRFNGSGRVTPQLAEQLGLTGLAGRASGQAFDLRCDGGWPPYDTLAVRIATHDGGDVAARVFVRFEETLESLRLVRRLCSDLPAGSPRVDVHLPSTGAIGAGCVEGWRGAVFVALEIDAAGRIRRCHCHDPSWQNWPALEHAIIGDIVPDFPLINKSFNLAYSGHDL